MNGRLENQKKTEERICRILNDQPEILTTYYISIGDKTHNTKLKYLNAVTRFVSYLNNNNLYIDNQPWWENIKPIHINSYMDFIKTTPDGTERSESYRCMQYHAVSSFFNFLLDNDYIEKNPCDKVKLPRVKKEVGVVYLTLDEVNQLESNIINGIGSDRAKSRQEKWKERDLALVHLVLCTGLRVSALTEINISDVDLNNAVIRVTEKENFTRDVYLDKHTVQLLKKWITKRKELLDDKESDALFISRERTRISTKATNEMIKKYAQTIGKHITTHKLRSTFAMNVYEATGDIYVTSNLLGHNSVETTKIYTTVTEQKKRAVADVLSNLYKK